MRDCWFVLLSVGGTGGWLLSVCVLLVCGHDHWHRQLWGTPWLLPQLSFRWAWRELHMAWKSCQDEAICCINKDEPSPLANKVLWQFQTVSANPAKWGKGRRKFNVPTVESVFLPLLKQERLAFLCLGTKQVVKGGSCSFCEIDFICSAKALSFCRQLEVPNGPTSTAHSEVQNELVRISKRSLPVPPGRLAHHQYCDVLRPFLRLDVLLWSVTSRC